MTQFSYSQEYAELSKFYQLNNLTRLSEVCRLGETQQYKCSKLDCFYYILSDKILKVKDNHSQTKGLLIYN